MTRVDLYGLADCDQCSYCPNGKWDVDLGLTASAAILFGANAADITFTCLSNNKKCKGKLYCGVVGAMVDVSVGWSIDFHTLGGGRVISGKCDKYDIKNYIVKGPILLAGSFGTSGNNLNVSGGLSFGIGYAWCHADYVSCDE